MCVQNKCLRKNCLIDFNYLCYFAAPTEKKQKMNIKIYGADWCPDCVNAKKFLKSKGVEFEYIVITDNKEAISFVEKINNGKRIIPTLVVDGETHINPGINGLMKILENKD